MFEIRFFVTGEVLASKLSQRAATASDYLASFDALRPRILEVAKAAYAATRSNTITLDIEHFR
jgi:hypothetical protein